MSAKLKFKQTALLKNYWLKHKLIKFLKIKRMQIKRIKKYHNNITYQKKNSFNYTIRAKKIKKLNRFLILTRKFYQFNIKKRNKFKYYVKPVEKKNHSHLSNKSKFKKSKNSVLVHKKIINLKHNRQSRKISAKLVSNNKKKIKVSTSRPTSIKVDKKLSRLALKNKIKMALLNTVNFKNRRTPTYKKVRVTSLRRLTRRLKIKKFSLRKLRQLLYFHYIISRGRLLRVWLFKKPWFVRTKLFRINKRRRKYTQIKTLGYISFLRRRRRFRRVKFMRNRFLDFRKNNLTTKITSLRYSPTFFMELNKRTEKVNNNYFSALSRPLFIYSAFSARGVYRKIDLVHQKGLTLQTKLRKILQTFYNLLTLRKFFTLFRTYSSFRISKLGIIPEEKFINGLDLQLIYVLKRLGLFTNTKIYTLIYNIRTGLVFINTSLVVNPYYILKLGDSFHISFFFFILRLFSKQIQKLFFKKHILPKVLLEESNSVTVYERSNYLYQRLNKKKIKKNYNLALSVNKVLFKNKKKLSAFNLLNRKLRTPRKLLYREFLLKKNKNSNFKTDAFFFKQQRRNDSFFIFDYMLDRKLWKKKIKPRVRKIKNIKKRKNLNKEYLLFNYKQKTWFLSKLLFYNKIKIFQLYKKIYPLFSYFEYSSRLMYGIIYRKSLFFDYYFYKKNLNFNSLTLYLAYIFLIFKKFKTIHYQLLKNNKTIMVKNINFIYIFSRLFSEFHFKLPWF